jgi:hypothetical protein
MLEATGSFLADEIKAASERITPITTSEVLARLPVDVEVTTILDRNSDGATAIELSLPHGNSTTTKQYRWMGAAVAAAALLVVGVFMVTDPNSDVVVTDPVSSPNTASSTPSPTVSAPPATTRDKGPAPLPAVTDSLGYEWFRVVDDENVNMHGVAAGGPGLVGFGSEESGDGSNAVVWTSVDGITWSRVHDDDAVFADAEIGSVTAGGPGLVAVGSDGSAAVVWTSPDGISWSRVPHDEDVFGGSNMTSVTIGGPGLVAVGGSPFVRADDTDGDRAVVWTSVDGFTWSRVPHDQDIFGGPRNLGMNSVTAGGPGLIAVGSADPHNGEDATVWTSIDGFIWSRVPHDEDVFGGLFDFNMTDVVAGPMGVVAVGWEFTGFDADAVVWTSIDGITWSRVPDDPHIFGGHSYQAMWAVIDSGNGFVAVGEDRSRSRGDGDMAVWTSIDGITWSRGLVNEEIVGAGYPLGVAVGSSGLVAVGGQNVWSTTIEE